MTDDDELIERVRRTLRAEAAAITPRPERQMAGRYEAPTRLDALRSRWPLALASAAVVAAAVTLTALNWPGGGSSRVGIVGPGPSTSVPQAPSTTTAPVVVPSVATTVVSPPTTVRTVTTVPVAPTPVAASFAPEAVTFVSPSDGWLAGGAPCGSTSCVAMARTLDGGHTWSAAPAPGATLSDNGSGIPAVSVRFANHRDGWIYALNPTRLWSTHDGGSHWTAQLHIAGLGPDANITAMEAAGGYVRIAVLSVNTGAIHVESSPVSSDAWTDTDTGVQIGAGPVPSTQLVLQGTAGWLLEDDRTVVGGARLDSSGRWSSWTPPCQKANGDASLAASSATDLVAACQEGVQGPAKNLPPGATSSGPSNWLFRSSDGGTTFQAVGAMPSTVTPEGVASPAPATIVVAGSLSISTPTRVLSASFDGGHTWQTVYQTTSNLNWFDLGFTTLTQGVAIGSTPSGSALYMTRDGGHHWAQVSL